jgi:hypothetical protein
MRRRDDANESVRRGRRDAEADFRRFSRGETDEVDLGRMGRDFGYGERMRALFQEARSRH